MKLSVIIPVFNEQKQIREVFSYLFRCACPIEREWIVVDDGSTDGSREELRQLKSWYSFKLIEQTENEGKGAAIITGLKIATGDLVMIQDADFEYDALEIPELLKPLITGAADVVYGSRFKRSGFQVHRTFHYLGNRLLTVLSNLFSGIYLTDMETCYKIFRRELIQSMHLKSKRFGIEVELTAYLAKTSARIFELPIRYYPRTWKQGKKIGIRDGIAALFHVIRFNLLTPVSLAFHSIPETYRLSRYRLPSGALTEEPQ